MHNSTEDESSSSVPPVRNISRAISDAIFLCAARRAARFTKSSSIPRIETAAVNIPPDNPFPRAARGGGPKSTTHRVATKSRWALVSRPPRRGGSVPRHSRARERAFPGGERKKGGRRSARDRSYSGVRIKREGGRNSDEGAEGTKGRKDGRARRDSAGC